MGNSILNNAVTNIGATSVNTSHDQKQKLIEQPKNHQIDSTKFLKARELFEKEFRVLKQKYDQLER